MHPNRYRTLAALTATVIVAGVIAAPRTQAGANLPFATATQTATDTPRGKHVRRPAKKLVKKAKAIKNEYIVVLDDDVIGRPGADSPAETIADSLIAAYGGRIHERFKHAINGFTARMTEAQAEAMSADSLVAYVEQDSDVALASVQTPAVWGLDRIDQRLGAPTNSYSYTYTGAGVYVYVIDSGIRTNHVEFGGRAYAVYDNVGDNRYGQDCNGHGTHVSGTIGGRTFGVAKGATLLSVRVFDCSGHSKSGAILAAVNWVTANAVRPAVVNMSLVASDYGLNNAIANSIARGITYVAAAGNSSADACSFAPANAPGVISVGATDGYDQRAYFSNYGTCVDVWAPGFNIQSASPSSTTATQLMSGTSQASPHVAGTAAIYLSAYPASSPSTVASAILGTATYGRLTGLGTGSPNRFLYSLLRP